MEIIEEYMSTNEVIDCKYKYRLTKSIYNGIVGYGIEIERQSSLKDKSKGLQKDGVPLVSIHRYKVKKILMKLYNNQASPIHLIDIIGEYVDEHVAEFNVATKTKDVNVIN